jgi:hypothetical protein
MEYWFVLCLATLLTIGGCGSGGDTGHLVPADQLARQALTAALDAWKAKKAPGEELQLPQGTKIHVLDLDWRNGRTLDSFEITQSLPAEPDSPRKFAVKIACDGGEPKDTVYHVLGADPLWVFRDEDLTKTTGM